MENSDTDSPRRSWAKEKPKRYEDLTMKDKVLFNTAKGALMEPRPMIRELGLDRSISNEELGELMKGQHRVAVAVDNWGYIERLQRECTLLFSEEWVNSNIPHPDPKKNVRRWKTPVATSYSSGMQGCGDVRTNVPRHIFDEGNINRQPTASATATIGSQEASLQETASRTEEVQVCQAPPITVEPRTTTSQQSSSTASCAATRELDQGLDLRSRTQSSHEQSTRTRSSGHRPQSSWTYDSRVFYRTDLSEEDRSLYSHSSSATSLKTGSTRNSSAPSRYAKSTRPSSATSLKTRSTLKRPSTGNASTGRQPSSESPLLPLRVTIRTAERDVQQGSFKRKSTNVMEGPRHKRPRQTCPIRRCLFEGPKMKWHVYGHFPKAFTVYTRDGVEDEAVDVGRVAGLRFLAEVILNGSHSLKELFDFVNFNFEFVIDNGVSKEIEEAIQRLHMKLGLSGRYRVRFNPLGSPACMIHWRVVAFLYNHLNDRQRERFVQVVSEAMAIPEGSVQRPSQTETPTVELAVSRAAPATETPTVELAFSRAAPVTETAKPAREVVVESTVLSSSPEQRTITEDRAVPTELAVSSAVQFPVDPMAPNLEQTSELAVTRATREPRLLETSLPEPPRIRRVSRVPDSITTPNPYLLLITEEEEDETMDMDISDTATWVVKDQVGPDQPEKGGEEKELDQDEWTIVSRKKSYAKMASASNETNPPVEPPKVQLNVDRTLPEAFDSHLHLNRLSTMAGKNISTPVEALNLEVGKKPVCRVGVTRGVIVQCDPEEFTQLLSIPESANWRVAVGVHPKFAHKMTDQHWRMLQLHLSNPMVSALGEVGLDHSSRHKDHVKHWDDQERVLKRVLDYCGLGHALVLHVRPDNVKDPLGDQLYQTCLEIVQKKCSKYQRIHLHCFNGSAKTYKAWSTAFPNCFFGFTGLVKHFNTAQRNALNQVPLNMLLIETDSPYLQVHDDQEFNTPAFIGDVAALVARIRMMPVEAVIRATAQNGCQLYGMRGRC